MELYVVSTSHCLALFRALPGVPTSTRKVSTNDSIVQISCIMRESRRDVHRDLFGLTSIGGHINYTAIRDGDIYCCFPICSESFGISPLLPFQGQLRWVFRTFARFMNIYVALVTCIFFYTGRPLCAPILARLQAISRCRSVG